MKHFLIAFVTLFTLLAGVGQLFSTQKAPKVATEQEQNQDEKNLVASVK